MQNKFIKNFYWQLKKTQAQLFGTKISEQVWVRQNFAQVKKIFSAEQSLNHSHRNFLVQKISAFQPIESILEIGCGNGPNLYWLSKQFPQANLIGVDINYSFIQAGRGWFTKRNIKNVKLMIGKADELDEFRDNSFDIVFTDALLMYIGPDKINKTICEFARLAKKAMLFLEWHDIKDQYYFGHWIRNYKNLIQRIMPNAPIHISKIDSEIWPDKNWQRFGHFIEVLL